MKTVRTRISVATAFAVGVTSHLAWVNPAAAQSESLQLEEIVVTARKREESIQDIPISVSAFGARPIMRLRACRDKSRPQNSVMNTNNSF